MTKVTTTCNNVSNNKTSDNKGSKNKSDNNGHGTSAGFCGICNKFVSNRTNHKYVHSQVKFKCKICGYLYSRKDTLKDHIRGKHHANLSTQELNYLVDVVCPSGLSEFVDNKEAEEDRERALQLLERCRKQQENRKKTH